MCLNPRLQKTLCRVSAEEKFQRLNYAVEITISVQWSSFTLSFSLQLTETDKNTCVPKSCAQITGTLSKPEANYEY